VEEPQEKSTDAVMGRLDCSSEEASLRLPRLKSQALILTDGWVDGWGGFLND